MDIDTKMGLSSDKLMLFFVRELLQSWSKVVGKVARITSLHT